MFGKPVSEYLRFQAVFLALIVAVGLVRLGLSLAGLPDSSVRWASMNVPLWVGTLYCGIAARLTGFGSYRQLLPLVFLQLVPFHAVAVLGILLAIAGVPNIFAAPEYSPTAEGVGQWAHVLAHLTIGMAVPTLLLWAVAAAAYRITHALARRPATA
ncbi:MAG: hypothetical protein AB7O37_20005 [Vicinamibacteria bacterium]